MSAGQTNENDDWNNYDQHAAAGVAMDTSPTYF